MAFLDEHGQSYLAWTWGPFDCARDPALVTDWAGTPTQNYGKGFKAHLIGLGDVEDDRTGGVDQR
jgi:endoglucanase